MRTSYALIMYKVGIIGPESSGKSTLARYLAKRYNGIYVPEYGRTFVEQKGTTEVTWDELCAIARHQIEELESYSGVVFFDTELIVTKIWFGIKTRSIRIVRRPAT